MFKNHKRKKHFPSGTFASTPIRVLAIIQLSLAFTVFLWYMSLPFMGETFAFKSKSTIYHTVMGKGNSSFNASLLEEKLNRHKERFDTLSPEDRKIVLDGYKHLIEESGKSFFNKFARSIYIVLFGIPTFEMAWMCLSFIISFMLLLKIPSAKEAVWLLPLVTVAFVFNQPEKSTVADNVFFPSESYIVSKYVKEPLSGDVFLQQKQLQEGWHRYLASEWAGKTLDLNFDRQVEQGEFNFYLAQVKANAGKETLKADLALPKSSLILSLYMLWNFVFAFITSRSSAIKVY